ncbi:MAG: ATP-binding protein [Evtepia sp.]
MHKLTANLLLYGALPKDTILMELSEIFRDHEEKSQPTPTLVRRTYAQIKKLLDLATEFGFDGNLWQNYLTLILMTHQNSFTLTAERAPAQEGSVNHFAKNDFKVFLNLFHFDFSAIEKDLAIDCFSTITKYEAIEKRERCYHKNVSEKVRQLSRTLAQASDADEFFQIITQYYRKVGVGLLGINQAFRVQRVKGELEFCPIHNTDSVILSDLVGYELQKEELRQNTEAFLSGRGANNVLLYGDSGTGKSSSVKALINEYYDRGLRMIEIYKHQFGDLSEIIAQTKNRNYYFIIFIDDLSFEENEVEYKFLKAIIEGGVETKPDNILIYATSNRRHLIRETWNDRNDMEHGGDVHRSDTMEEKLSLSSRFGVQINYSTPSRAEYHAIVLALAKRSGIVMDDDALLFQANQWELRHGGISGRTAQQFVYYLAGTVQNPIA